VVLPAVDNGVVYIGARDGLLYAFNAQTGTLLWNVNTGSGVGTPAVANWVVYFNSSDGNIHAVNAQTGQILWTYSTGDIYPSSLQ